MSVAVAAAVALVPVAARAQAGGVPNKRNPLQGIEVTGTSSAGNLVGTLNIERFQVVGDQLLAVGQMSGKIGNKAFNHQAVAFPVAVAQGTTTGMLKGKAASGATAVAPATYDPARGLQVVPAQGIVCSILDLSLGPIDLNLLGLVVHVDEINITIDAQAGGGLLGNLLCGLDLGGLLGNLLGLANLLNQIANLLNGILGGL